MPLVELRLIKSRLLPDDVTHVDRGKVVHLILLEAIEKLRPDTDQPGYPANRTWWQYLILYKAYVEDIQNREIMALLNISDGTFNRARRSALRAITQLLKEMDMAEEKT
jgi:hypothetical protein